MPAHLFTAVTPPGDFFHSEIILPPAWPPANVKGFNGATTSLQPVTDYSKHTPQLLCDSTGHTQRTLVRAATSLFAHFIECLC